MTVMKKMDVLGILQEHGAVVSGHFQLASGLHSPVYVQTAVVLQYPHVAQKIAKAEESLQQHLTRIEELLLARTDAHRPQR